MAERKRPSFKCLILAAGMGRRMKSDIPKVVHPILGIPIINYVLNAVYSLSPKDVFVVTGHRSELIQKELHGSPVKFVYQKEQLGTGHAVLSSRDHFKNYKGDILILNGDFPLIKSKTLKSLLRQHTENKCSVSVLTGEVENPKGYGRIIRNSKGEVVGVVEEKDSSREQKKIREINSGAYFVDSKFLWDSLEKLSPANSQKELYLPQIIDIAYENKKKIGVKKLKDINEILGVNTRGELVCAESYIRNEINSALMVKGVTIIDPDSTFISPNAKIAADTTIYPNTYIYGYSSIGSKCTIGPSVWIRDSAIGSGVNIRMNCFVEQARVKNNVVVGPFANIRPESVVEDNAKIGNFVELKKTRVGRGSKVPHLSYVGDATLGKDVNMGAGTITCNYDGVNKNKTIIEDGVFIGSDTMLVAPVKVGKNATTGAGSTITKEVSENALAIERSKQIEIKNWKRPQKKK
ncbi:MAG: UDP-N-acetylglucosamine diphosphorylase/glucosamine-1-phosphate N-acetyltransferase [Candidatus Dadabacteria bacterium]|nr:UDP-N-acetylglucosamine diphosphorylase/glucosamine-1-phosphate N-acetyltransferase [Candidatus Dadabacteria bacterium]NIS09283.1 UDP-N-acetylglucosamine diphosphorylase/glucosamine-1-phosphate N-acetyltransferase [Candidatus Dadabacteria bacterium]NIV41967.1 UDP-N-acetylglucosamine diphosphorylase/glucosamine-1-phosphate N-acetyltransferase [Candidatus Dadabacteria bacterium]NIX15828.1 UDP-N-acetylglucosamine diphosphorylase/glucosamine-1-phosphate N-acetyltransferase [Candidatus Dadabacteri